MDEVREAGRWLAHLHAMPVREGDPWAIWRNFHRLGRRLLKAAAHDPANAALLRPLFERLTEVAPHAETPPRLVQTHGQFRDLHLFFDDGRVRGIDLDRSRPADPAKDLDEFLHRLRWKTFKRLGRDADDLTAAFLGAYAEAASPDDLRNLPFYSAFHALFSLARYAQKSRTGPEREAIMDFYRREFEQAMSGGFTW